MGQQHHHKEDTMATAGWVVRIVKDVLLEHTEIDRVIIRVDNTGVGGGVTDRLNEIVDEEGLYREITPINNNGKTLDEYYGNLGSEMWGTIRTELEANMIAFINVQEPEFELPDDDTLISQLSTRKWCMSSKGKIMLESKADIKKRGLKSPDRADAFVLTFGEYLVEPEEQIMIPSIGSVTQRKN